MYTAGSVAMRPAFTPLMRRRFGMGELDPHSRQIANLAATGATTTAQILLSLSVISGPVGLAIAGLVGAGMVIANIFSGCGQSCVQATNIAEQVSAVIDQAFDTYMNSPVHYRSMQVAYLNIFDTTWAALKQACSDPALGDAGRRCISDRQAGSCHWKTSPGGWVRQGGTWVYVPPGPNGSGDTCWNSFVGRRDPVADDPTVVPDPVSSGVLSSLGVNPSSSLMGIPLSLLLPGGLILLGLAMSEN